jgi:iron complex transport system substrate-binding protein
VNGRPVLSGAAVGGISRRTALSAAGILGVFAAAGCGTGADRPPAAGAEPAEGFPVTVEHKFGSTEITAAPQRVVTVGLTDHDTVLALGLGERLVGVTNFYEEYEHAAWPWAVDALGGATPEVMPRPEGDRPDLELIAGLEPDLIIGQYCGLTQEDYEGLTMIAPTVAQRGDHPDWGAPWEEMTLAIGRALGREDQAGELVRQVQDAFERARRDHPEFDGMSAVVAERLDASYVVRSATDPRTRFLDSLGFVLPEEVAELTGDKDAAPLSQEDIDLLDRDLLVWNAGFSPELREELADNEVYRSLPVAEEGRALVVDDVVVSGALTWSTVLSLPFAIEELAPRIAAAVDGDPATS